MMQTGRQFAGGVETPHAGAVVSYLRGRRSDLPPFVVLPELMGRGGGNLPNGQAGGFLGQGPRSVRPDGRSFAAEFQSPGSAASARHRPGTRRAPASPPRDRRRDARDSVRGERRRPAVGRELPGRVSIDDQPPGTRGLRPGAENDGDARTLRDESLRPVLPARAADLIEAGVRFVTINTFLTVFDEITWDIHGSKPFTSIEGMRDIVAPMYDQAYSALDRRPVQRGLLDERSSPAWPSLAGRRRSTRRAVAIIGRSASPSVLPAAESKAARSSERAIRLVEFPTIVLPFQRRSLRPSCTASAWM